MTGLCAVRRAGLAARPPRRATRVGAHGPAPADRRPRADRADPGVTKVLLRPVTRRVHGVERAAGPSRTRRSGWSPTWGRCGSGTCRRSTTRRSSHAAYTCSSTSPSPRPGFLYWWHLLSPIRSRLRLGGLAPIALHGLDQARWSARSASCSPSSRAALLASTTSAAALGADAAQRPARRGCHDGPRAVARDGRSGSPAFARMLAESEEDDRRAERYDRA